MSWLELAVIAFIIVSIGWVVWRGGAANPESTGSLGRKVAHLSSKVSTLDARSAHVEAELESLKKEAATTKDIDRIEERLATVRAEMDGDRKLAERTYRGVERIERILLERGLK